ncbi:MAG TPA: hypothetical protein VFI15_10105 [Candidatus Limnocylindrales bacterium]|nr:hypothetical protein [Candidatus Limnocylindrales bacterium]
MIGRRAALTVLAVLALLAAGCDAIARPSGSTGPADSFGAGPPTPHPAFGLTWAQVEDVERPIDAFASAIPTAPSGPGTAGHPGHFPGQSILADVAVDGDRLVAVGYTFIAGAWTADAWTSTDSLHWALATVDTRPGSFAVGVATAPGGGFVAVGRVADAPAAWTSPDGRTWQPATVERLAAGARAGEPERMATLLATRSGFLAGGSAGPELGDRQARLWRSTDGTTWTAVSDRDGFAGGEVVALAEADGGSALIALGRLGTGQRATGSVAWTATGGDDWIRHDDPALAAGLVAAVAPAPGGGWLAVGSDGDEREALAWSSVDGASWTTAPREPSRLHSGEKIRMTDVIATDRGFVAIGNFVGVQYGDGTSWLSVDGTTWQAAPLQASLGQGEPEAIVAWQDRLVIVGSRGAPDNYIPTAWVGPTAP